jgi:hypothetical protein
MQEQNKQRVRTDIQPLTATAQHARADIQPLTANISYITTDIQRATATHGSAHAALRPDITLR